MAERVIVELALANQEVQSVTSESLEVGRHEAEEKERRVRSFIAEQGFDALVLTTQANFAWFTCGGDSHVAIGADSGSASVVVTPERKYIICDNIEAPRILDEELAGQGFEFHVYDWWFGSLSDEIRQLARGRIAADTPIAGTELVASQIPPLRYSLTEAEMDRYRWLGKVTGECLSEAAHEVRPGMTEHQIASALGARLLARGVIPNLILIAADERIGRFRHPIPTDKVLDRYALLVAGAKKWGLVVSASRIVHFGSISADLRRRHDAVIAVDAEFIARTRPGTSVDYIFAKGAEAYERTGYADEWRLHHQGGATGYAGRDYRALPGTREVVRHNQAFAWNPTVTGTKCEDTILALADHTEIISAHGVWPMRQVQADGMVIARPDILEL